MALGLYKEPNPDFKFKTNSPFANTFDGRVGGIIHRKIYLRNDDSTVYYTNTTVTPVDPSGDNIVNGSKTGWHWKLYYGDNIPTLYDWQNISPGNTITIPVDIGTSSLGDTYSFLPIWIQLKIPKNQYIQKITDVVLRISTTENLI